MTAQGCHVSFSIADHGAGWNFLLSGAYQQVLFARGTILKDCPIQVCFSFVQIAFKISRPVASFS
jgi:D-alanyl-lipoteichoic acid acyltransferase DltB (MBOAT superfamily)